MLEPPSILLLALEHGHFKDGPPSVFLSNIAGEWYKAREQTLLLLMEAKGQACTRCTTRLSSTQITSTRSEGPIDQHVNPAGAPDGKPVA